MDIKINPQNIHISPPKSIVVPQKSHVQSLPTQSASIEKQLSFMGTINKPAISTATALLERYKNRPHFKLNGATIFCSQSEKDRKNVQRGTIIFDKPLLLQEGIDKIRAVKQGCANGLCDGVDGQKVRLLLWQGDFETYKKVIANTPQIKNLKIKGFVGQGTCSTAFVTEDNNVLKLSAGYPVYPAPEHMIEGVDLPIFKRFAAKHDGSLVYGVVEPLAVNTEIRPIPEKEYREIRNDFYKKIKAANPKYEFAYDFSEESIFAQQIGFVGGKPYILDHQVIQGRPLFEMGTKL